jgi:hypothetical protein
LIPKIQEQLIQLVKRKLSSTETIGQVLSEVLSVSQDAAYRRLRNETPLTIDEVRRLCIYFDISFDSLLQLKEANVAFSYMPLNAFDFSLESYLEGILKAFQRLKTLDDPQIILTINNMPFLQLINIPQLLRFRLFFWAKTYLKIPEYQDMQFRHEKVPERAFDLGMQIISLYNAIPSIEIYDPELMRGFLRQVLYYFNSNMFEDPTYALFLCDRALMFSKHLKEQATCGKKFVFGTQVPLIGNKFDMYLNETINTDAAFYYETKEARGLYLTHNVMNYLHATDQRYVEDTKQILDIQLANSSLISIVNEKERNHFFFEFDKTIGMFRKKIEAEIEFAS